MFETVVCRDDAERSRLLDMSRRLRPAYRRVAALWAICAVVAIPVYGWLPLLPLLCGLAVVLFDKRVMRDQRLRERRIVMSWAAVVVLSSLWIALSDGPRLPLFVVLAVSMYAASAVFSARVALACGVAIVALMVALAVAFSWATVHAEPGSLIVPVMLVIAVGLLGAVAAGADAASRSTAVVDQLTGVLNRVALEARVVELAHHAAMTGGVVAVVVGDLDRFKTINDEYGHAIGDRVLAGVAARLQTALGAAEAVYRFGGEEFVVLLPGCDAHAAMTVAERLRAAVRATPIAGHYVSMSFGVSASVSGEGFDYRSAFGHADAALFEAKDAGRDCVRLSDSAASIAWGSAVRTRQRRGAMLGSAGRSAGEPVDGWDRRIARDRSEAGNWLIASRSEREHMLDVNERFERAAWAPSLAVLIALLSATPVIGWWPVVGMIAFGTVFHLVAVNAVRLRRPEYWLLGAVIAAEAGYSLGLVLARSDRLVALPLLVVMLGGTSAVFPPRGALVATLVAAVMVTATALIVGGAQIAHDPMLLVAPLAVLGGIAFIGAAVGRSAVDHRSAAIVDRLTGLLSRVALQARVTELAHRSETMGEHASLIVGDIDHFKAINDRHGHAAGDEALKEIAQRIVGELRAFEPAYRIGGEEFLIVLSGVDVEAGVATAERLRAAVAELDVEGDAVTMSFGVSGSADGERFDYERVFARADAALYEAKLAGRNRVAVRAVAPRSVHRAA